MPRIMRMIRGTAEEPLNLGAQRPLGPNFHRQSRQSLLHNLPCQIESFRRLFDHCYRLARIPDQAA